MKERPILFSTEMVRAILDGRKTQTRRTRGLSFIEHIPFGTGLYKEPYQKEDGQWYYQVQTKVDDSQENLLKCPYGQIGDVLWVKETWRIVGWRDGEPFVIEYKDGKHKRDVYLNESRAEDYNIECTDQCFAAGLKTDSDDNFIRPKEGYPTKWRPSIFMPKTACRIRLQITNIRVERLQDITEEGCKAEGAETDEYLDFREWAESVAPAGSTIQGLRDYFAQNIWDKINQRGEFDPNRWEANPWVWCISFKNGI